MAKLLISLFFVSFFGVSSVMASPTKSQFSVQHELAQRFVIFPFKVSSSHKEQSENIWWDIRSKLSSSKRFLIASKNFMQSKNVFQPRSELASADAVLLGRLLDAHALLTFELQDFSYILRVYDGRTGHLLNYKKIELHPSVPASEQLSEASEKLVLDFVAAFPYQSYVVVDQLAGRAVYKEGEKQYLKSYLGESHKASVGDKVQVVNVFSKSLEPLFQAGGHLDVIAEGTIVSIEDNTAKVELDRQKSDAKISEYALVRLPKEEKRLQDTFALLKSKGPSIELDAMGQADRLTDKQKERKPLITALSFIANIVIMFIAVL